MRCGGLLVVALLAFMSQKAAAWDPIGDLRNPGRILDNARRETERAIRDIPNVPRNIVREGENVGREIDRWRIEGQANAGAPILEAWLHQSRRDASSGGTNMIPPEIRRQMEHFYDQDLLNRVRWKIGDAGVVNLANLSITYGERDAIVLIDLIVFKGQESASDAQLWAHELMHVKQYRDWGVRDFAVRYLRSWNAVENEATDAENRWANSTHAFAQQQQQFPPQSSFPPPALPQPAYVCATPQGTCGMQMPGQRGFPCHCPSPWGWIQGVSQ
jgi:hypothetical protein